MSNTGREWLARLLSKRGEEPPLESVFQRSRDANGFVREKAVRELGCLNTQEAFEAILERLNDWVPEVRVAAVASLDRCLKSGGVPVVLASLEALFRLKRKRRGDHEWVLQRVSQLLEDPAVREQVQAQFQTARGDTARFLFERLCASNASAQAGTFVLAAKHRDFTVRRLGLIHFCPAVPAMEALRSLLSDPNSSVRSLALTILFDAADASDLERENALYRSLIDPSASVRMVALWLARRESVDVQAFLTAQLRSNRTSPAQLIGLLGLVATLKDEESFDFIADAFTDSNATVRAAALHAWVVTFRASAEQAVSTALADPSRKVARLARQFVARGDIALTREQIVQAVDTNQSEGRLAAALATTQFLPRWDRLEVLLACLARSHSSTTQPLVEAALECWVRGTGNSYLQLITDAQMTQIGARIAGLPDRIALARIVGMSGALEAVGLWPPKQNSK